jgi:hypothetical protein
MQKLLGIISYITNWVFSIYKILEVSNTHISPLWIVKLSNFRNIYKFFLIENNNSDTEFYLRFVLVYTTTHEKLKLLVFPNCAEWVSPEWNSYQTVLITRSQLIFKNKGEEWFFLIFLLRKYIFRYGHSFHTRQKGFQMSSSHRTHLTPKNSTRDWFDCLQVW